MCNEDYIGDITYSPCVFSLLIYNNAFMDFCYDCIERYKHRDWGNIDDFDMMLNVKAIRNREQIYACYDIPAELDLGRFIMTRSLIITTDKSRTLVSFTPEVENE